jgi:septal ring factor EnvC (AmiA/AmiB activator)
LNVELIFSLLLWHFQSAEEVARWDERKRWQHTGEKLKQKLKERAAEVDNLNSTIRSLKDVTTRLEREKIVLDSRLRASRSKFWSCCNIFSLVC